MVFGWPAPEVQWAIVLGMAAPFVLLLSRWLPLGVANRFNATAAIVLGLYALACLFGSGKGGATAVIAGAALLVSALIFILGFWGVLTRGYSVALLVALDRLGGCAAIDELANAYSGGRGLRWLADKRLGGLAAARVVAMEGGQVAITESVGRLVLRCYAVFQACFRLKDYG